MTDLYYVQTYIRQLLISPPNTKLLIVTTGQELSTDRSLFSSGRQLEIITVFDHVNLATYLSVRMHIGCNLCVHESVVNEVPNRRWRARERLLREVPRTFLGTVGGRLLEKMC